MEHSRDEPNQSSPRMSWRYSELPSAKVPPRRKDDLSASALQDRGVTNTNTEGTRTYLNGYANYLSDSEDSIHSSLDGNRDGDDNGVNDRVHDSDENDNDDDDDNADNDSDNLDIECNDDDKCDNGNDSLDDDDDDDGDNIDNDDDSDDNDDDDDDDDDDDNDDGDDGDISQDVSYSCPDGNISVESEKVNQSLTQTSRLSLRNIRSNEEKINSNENVDYRPGSSSNNNISGEKVYEKNQDSSISSEGDNNAELVAAGGATPYAHKKNSPIVAVASQGARPKTSSQTTVLSNVVEPDLHDGKIPSLDVIGISQGFLARHTTDQSLPYSLNTEGNDLPTSESSSSIYWPQTSITSNDNSSMSWSLPESPFPGRSELLQDRAYPGGVNPRYGDPRNVGYQPTAPMTGLGTGWQLSNEQQPQSGRTASNFPPEDQLMSNRAESWLTSHDESHSHPNVLGHFLGATGTQGGDSFNRQAWMPGNETTWRRPRYDYNRHQTNPSRIGDLTHRNEPAVNSPAANPSAPAVTLPSVTLPNTSLNFQTAASDPLTSQSSSSTAMSGSHNFHLSQATTSTEDTSLVALERKVAEACAIVERVLKDREERTKRQREEVQRQREIREQRQREARERREREERERRERAEREAREREDMAVAERAPVQESPLWQCEHYQRRCSVRFPCCGVFYPCHRCHNGSGACEADDKKANQATHVRCASCGHEEEVSGLF